MSRRKGELRGTSCFNQRPKFPTRVRLTSSPCRVAWPARPDRADDDEEDEGVKDKEDAEPDATGVAGPDATGVTGADTDGACCVPPDLPAPREPEEGEGGGRDDEEPRRVRGGMATNGAAGMGTPSSSAFPLTKRSAAELPHCS